MARERKIVVTEDVMHWRVRNGRDVNVAMEVLAEKYLEGDRFPQGDNEEISVIREDGVVALRVKRTYGPNELSQIDKDQGQGRK